MPAAGTSVKTAVCSKEMPVCGAATTNSYRNGNVSLRALFLIITLIASDIA
jgi:hypothetical protein